MVNETTGGKSNPVTRRISAMISVEVRSSEISDMNSNDLKTLEFQKYSRIDVIIRNRIFPPSMSLVFMFFMSVKC